MNVTFRRSRGYPLFDTARGLLRAVSWVASDETARSCFQVRKKSWKVETRGTIHASVIDFKGTPAI